MTSLSLENTRDSSNKSIVTPSKLLNTYRGTATYMAPEIKEGKPYDGLQADIFSAGVILFILALGIYPFKDA